MGTRTNWEHNVLTGNTTLPQIEHLKQCIDYCSEKVTLIAPFDLWKTYENSPDGQLRLYAQRDWQHINNIVSVIDQQDSKWVYAAINRYLLICDANPSADNDYDQAIFEFISKNLKKYKIVDYQYQSLNHTGNVGNFVSPDNRMLCKKL